VTTEAWLRLLAAGGAVLVGRSGRRWTVAAAGLLAGVAAFGWSPTAAARPAAAVLAVPALLGLGLLALLPRWLPITGDGLLAGALFGVPAAAVAAVSARAGGPAVAAASAAVVLGAVSLFSAESVRAAAESGARRAATLVWAAVVASGFAAGAVAVAAPSPRQAAPGLLAAGLAVALAAWIPAVLLERRRVRRELEEEVRLGLLPAEDASALELPWRRFSEKRFGRPDERREYVRSALLLAVARAQQRRRSGEAERLRQLEVLTFRTRLRRTLEARATRHREAETGEAGESGEASPGR
jgi:hypothetical protein